MEPGENEDFLLTAAPPSFYYIPDFISEAEEANLMRHIEQSPGPRWTQLANRRLQNWGGVPHPKGMLAEPMPPWLLPLVNRVSCVEVRTEDNNDKSQQQIFTSGKGPNHVLVNEYLPGQGIMPHTDGPLFHPTIATVTLGSHTVLRLYSPLEEDSVALPWDQREVAAVLVRRRSLVVLKDQCYSSLLHGIQEVKEDQMESSIVNLTEEEKEQRVMARNTRISLTIRHVPKTSKLKIRL